MQTKISSTRLPQVLSTILALGTPECKDAAYHELPELRLLEFWLLEPVFGFASSWALT